MARFVLVFVSGKYEGGRFELPERGETALGRGGELDIVLVEDMVSRKHAILTSDGDSLLVEDLGSTNGTFLNGKNVSRSKLKAGDHLGIGSSVLEVQFLEEGVLPDTHFKFGSQDENTAQKEALQKEDTGLHTSGEGVPPVSDSAGTVQLPQVPSQTAMHGALPGAASPVTGSNLRSSMNTATLDSKEVAAVVQHQTQDFVALPDDGRVADTSLELLINRLLFDEDVAVLTLQNDEAQFRLESVSNTSLVVHQHEGDAIAPKEIQDPLKVLARLMTQEFESYTFRDSTPEHDEPVRWDIRFEGHDPRVLLKDYGYQADELMNLVDDLPEPEDMVSIPRPIEARLSELHQDELDLFQLIFNYGFYQHVLDKSAYGDLACAKALLELQKKGVVKF